MKSKLEIVLVIYYTFGTILLPMSDFSIIANLPTMYANCKATEDKDMTALDFITDHLINIDSLFDKHNHGDEQKPHKSTNGTCNHTSNAFFQEINTVQFKKAKSLIPNAVPITNYEDALYFHNPIFSIFRPPIDV